MVLSLMLYKMLNINTFLTFESVRLRYKGKPKVKHLNSYTIGEKQDS